jgi:hypothetical protein
MHSGTDDGALPPPGFPIRKSPDLSLVSGFPELIAATRVLHRLLAPRHPPRTLSSLTTITRAFSDTDYCLLLGEEYPALSLFQIVKEPHAPPWRA